MNRRKTTRRIITCSVLCTVPFIAATPAHADIPWDHNYATNAEDDHATLDASMKGNIPAPNTPNGACSIVCVSVFLFERIDA